MKKVGVNYQTIGYLETEEYGPGLDLALRVCDVSKIPVESVFSISPMEKEDNDLARNS